MELTINNQKLLWQSMTRIRRTEEIIAERYREQQMRCPTHLCIGQEAIPVGVSAALNADDMVFSNHRAHGHYLAKGGSLPALIAELYGRSSGCCGGRGGSMHLIDISAGFMGATPIVGGTVPLAVGTSWASLLQGKKAISVAYFGDGCFEEGVMHESMNFAAAHSLPVLFVCENNGYAVYTGLDKRQPDRSIANIAHAHGWQTYSGDGNNVEEVAKIARQAADNARQGNGPQFMEFSTFRWMEHCGPGNDDHLNYRPDGALVSWQKRCPIARLRSTLEALPNFEIGWFDQVTNEINYEIKQAFEFALASPVADEKSAGIHVYAE